MVKAKKDPPLRANTGRMRTPTTFFSVAPGPGNWVCFWYQIRARWIPMSARMIAGISRMCMAYRRGIRMLPGKSPPNSAQCIQVPISGRPMVMPESAARIPVPESRSSGREYPKKPSNIARMNSSAPMTQLASRGRRNAPVKKIRAMCTMIDAANISAAQ
ncbi:Uncharacterised protein [Mycobacteroides abscessus subsp. abscessus]|nr:Uncharacterised protein [Mycobacteroides abscessus subsp. abscessus]